MHLHALHLSHVRLLVSPKEELKYTSGTLAFVVATSLDSLTLVTVRACVHRFNRMVTKKETASNGLSPEGSVQSEHTETPITSLPLKEVYLHTFKADA